MSQKIESKKLLIQDVFDKRWYDIPHYQRPYVWGKDQVNELLEDIMQASINNPDSDYFLGSSVWRIKNENNYSEFEILDGQQRLTTLLLIMAVVRDLTDNSQRVETCQNFIFQKENKDRKIPERLRIIFGQTEINDFVNTYVKENKGTDKIAELKKKQNNITVENMSNAILTIREFFEDSENDIDTFFPFFCSNVLIIYVSTENLDDAFRLFTTLNNRGVKLRSSDILKANNLSQVPINKQNEYAQKWADIENYFEENFDQFLSHIRSILVKKKASSNLLKEFEKEIYEANKLKQGKETFDLFYKYRIKYESLLEKNKNIFENDNDNHEFYNYIQLMQIGFDSDYWVAPLLRYYAKFDTDNLLEFTKALNNKFASDWIVRLTPTKRIANVNAILNAIDDIDNTSKLLSHKSLEYGKDKSGKENKEKLKESLEGNVYGERFAKYILLKLDFLYRGNKTFTEFPKKISIEHILPQNPKKISQWREDFTDEEREEWTNKLGNLVLISRSKNSSQGNKDYKDKVNNYFKKNIETFSNSMRVYQKYPTSWDLNNLKENHEDVLKKIKEEFNI